MFEVVSDPTRLALLTHMHLHTGSTVGELAEAAGASPSAASKALRVLRESGVVTVDREGRTAVYTITDAAAHHVLHLMGQDHH